MARNGADFTLTFRRLATRPSALMVMRLVRSLFTDPSAFDDWAIRWRRRLADDGEATGEQRAAAMRAVNPAFIPRNHLVEEALSAAVNNGDLTAFDTLLTVLSRPYEDQQSIDFTQNRRDPSKSSAKHFVALDQPRRRAFAAPCSLSTGQKCRVMGAWCKQFIEETSVRKQHAAAPVGSGCPRCLFDLQAARFDQGCLVRVSALSMKLPHSSGVITKASTPQHPQAGPAVLLLVALCASRS